MNQVPAVSPSPKELATDALRYWEPRRLAYSLVLVAVTTGEAVARWPTASRFLSVNGFLDLFVLAVIANLLYCAAYVADIFVQLSGFRATWRRERWVLLLLGTCFAAVLAHFVCSALFGRSYF